MPVKRESKFEKLIGEHPEDLPVVITIEERADRSLRLAQIEEELSEHYAREEEMKKSFKANETRLEAERKVLAGIVRSGKELRPVVVEHWADFKAGIREDIRSDSGEVLAGRSRPLTDGERQGSLISPRDGALLSPQAAKEEAEKLVDKKIQKREAKSAAKEAARDR